MKILFVGHTYTVRANHAKISALAKQPGVEIVLVTPQGWRGPLYENRADHFETKAHPNVRHEVIRAIGIGKEGAYIYEPRILSVIRRFQPDVVHVEQGSYALCFTQILLALQLLSPATRASFFTWWNLPYELSGLKRITERYNLRHAAAAVAGNHEAKLLLEEHGFTERIAVIPQLGVEIEEVQHERESEKFTVGYIGRVTEEKGVLDLAEAITRMRNRENTHLYVLGTGPALQEMKSVTRRNDIDCTFLPAVRNEAVLDHLRKLDVLVLPSRSTPEWVEQFGHILIEAMAAGVPVVGSSSGEIPRVIGNAGLVFAEGNTGELAAVLDRLAEDTAFRAELSKAGLDRVKAQYTHEEIARRQFVEFQWMIEHGRPVGANASAKSASKPIRPQGVL